MPAAIAPVRVLIAGAGAFGREHLGRLAERSDVEVVGVADPDPAAIELVRSRLEASGTDRLAGRRAVLTGGASQLQGVRELATLILDKQVRMGRPLRTGGLADSTGGPAFATGAGLLNYAVTRYAGPSNRARATQDEANVMLGRFGSWLKDNL